MYLMLVCMTISTVWIIIEIENFAELKCALDLVIFSVTSVLNVNCYIQFLNIDIIGTHLYVCVYV